MLPHEDPECIDRIVFCGFMEGCVANQLQRVCQAVSPGGPCKRISVTQKGQIATVWQPSGIHYVQ